MTLFCIRENHDGADRRGMDDDNVVVVISGVRLDPQQLVSKVSPDSPGRSWLFRSLVGVFAGVLTGIVFNWVGDVWALLIACVTMALAVWRSDGTGVHDLLSELSSRRPAGQSVTVRPGLEISTVRVADLRAGDRVYPADEFGKQMADYDRRLAERAAWSERMNTTRQEAYERHKRRRGDRGSTAPPPSPYRGLPVSSPTIRYREVVAARPERNGRRVRIGLACGQIIKKDPGDDMLVQRWVAPVRKRDTEPAARALEALLVELPRRPRPVSERHLVAALITDHTEPAIRRALRAAVATHLVSRQAGFGQFLGRVGRALVRGPDNNWHGEDCELTLTHLGELWLTAIAIPHDQTTGSPDAPAVNITIQNFQIGDHNVIQQTVPTTRERELVAIKQLLTAMSTNTAGLRDVTEALHTLEDAVAHSQPDTPASRSALRTVLKRSSRDVLIGVIGNAAYTLLLSLAGSPPQ